MTTRGTEHVPAVLFAKAARPDGTLDEAKLAKLMAENDKLTRKAFLVSVVDDGLEPVPDRVVASHPSVPRTKATRGPWVLSVEGLGRPLTFNAERKSSMSAATMAKVREQARRWKEAVAQAAIDAGIPRMPRVFTVIQPYYPSNVVVDPDGIPAMHKAAHDGLVLANVIPNDKREQLTFGYHPLPPVTDGQDVRLTVTVYPLPRD